MRFAATALSAVLWILLGYVVLLGLAVAYAVLASIDAALGWVGRKFRQLFGDIW